MCGALGFVRSERVLENMQFYTLYYCGNCNRTWKILDMDRASKPDHPDSRGSKA
jgi:hypothetical protein